jgi:heme-degrading monooxygenase HmoA
MPEIRSDGDHVTQITTAEVEDRRHQDELLQLMSERARFMATQPGFISISLHRSLDGKRVVNYVQWESREALVEAHRAPEFRAKWPQVGQAAEDIEPALYEVVHVET